MALVLADRVQETSTSTGSSLFALGGAVNGFQTFNVGIGNSNTTYYTITDGISWMDVIGTYTTANNSLTVDTVLSSSAGGTTAVNFSTGIKNVFCTYPASKAVYEDASNQVTLAGQLNLTKASNYNLYASGAGANYLAGKTGFGSTSLGGVFGHVSNQLTLSGAIDCVAYGAINTINSDVTNSATIYKSQPATQAASFILPTLLHFSAQQYTIGAGSAITNQYGFLADSSLTNAASNNHGFRGNISAGTNRYNLYMNGTAANYLAGDLQLAKTVTAAGTTGAQTINKTTGTVNFAAGATSLVVTNSLVTANSIIIATVGSNDTTMKSVAVVAGAGSFTLHANAAATAETRINFLITN